MAIAESEITWKLSGKVVLITGAGSGIGRASALAFARAGASVVLADWAAGGGEETLRLINEAGGEALFVRADVSVDSEVRALISKAVETYGRLDYAHNNAGVEGTMAGTADCTEDNWDRIISINLKGVWLCMKYEISQMLTQGGGSVVNTASVAGLVGIKGFPAYVASKHGIVGLTKAAALEYGKNGIRLNAICPGLIDTPMIKRQTGGDPEAEARLMAGEPSGRMGRPEEVAAAVLWLCSEAASFVNGHSLIVDGGYVTR